MGNEMLEFESLEALKQQRKQMPDRDGCTD